MNERIAQVLLNGSRRRSAYTYRHTVSFEETNVVGNVYFTRHLAWQGRCRELFLKENAPGILAEINRDLRLVTLRVSCEYFQELNALDEIDVQMSLAHLRQHKIGLNFQITGPETGTCAASGFQEIACMRKKGGGLIPVLPPAALTEALKRFAGPHV